MGEDFMSLILGRPDMRSHVDGMKEEQKGSNSVMVKKVIDEGRSEEGRRNRAGGKG